MAKHADELDPVTRVVLETVADSGLAVNIQPTADRVIVTATSDTGERYIVRGPDTYLAAVELARQLGFDLLDG